MVEKIYKNKLSTTLIIFLSLMFKVYLARILIFKDYNPFNVIFTETWFAVLIILIILLIKNTKIEALAFITIDILFSLLLLTFITYFKFYGNIITYTALLQINQIGGIKLDIMDLLSPASMIFFADILLIIFFKVKNKNEKLIRVGQKTLVTLLIVTFSFTLFINIAGNNDEIVNENIQAKKMGLFTYQLYTYISDHFITASAVPTNGDITNHEEIPQADREMFGIAKDKNIIFVQLEAFLNFPIGLKIDGQEITPNLNKLVNESIYFENFYQQIGTGTTSDAEFITNTSVHPVGDVAMSYVTRNNDVPSLVRILNDKEYETVTFHTNDVYFWDRNFLYQALGYDRYYDEQFFGTDNYISFGSSDEILYEKTVPELKRISDGGNKFFASVVSMSSHHPYRLPEEYHQIDLPDEFDDSKFGRYLISVNYADYALGKFMDDLKAKGLYEDTLFVFYGDHYALPIKNENDALLFEKYTNTTYSDYLDKYNIPLIIHIPWQKEQKTVELVGGQVDTMPTVLNLIGINPDDYHLYGKDLLNSTENVVPIRYYIPSGSFVNNDIFYIPGESFEDGYAIDVNTRQEVTDISKYKDEYEKVVQILQDSEQYLTTFPYVERDTSDKPRFFDSLIPSK